MVQAASLVLAANAQAQTSACDLLKAELAARIESTGVRVYTLEAVPADAPEPPSARVIGNCEAGAYKILYSRPATATAASAAPSASARIAGAAAPASAAKAIAAPDEPIRRPPGVQSGRGLVAPPWALASSSVAPQPAMRSSEAASTPAAPRQGLEKLPLAGAGEVGTGRAVDRPVVAPVPVVADKIAQGGPSLAQAALAFLAESWHWIAALLVLALLAWFWYWRAQHSGYDKSGLPLGPRL